MGSFKGEENYSIDIKGRVNIPAKMRKYISPMANETFVLTKGFDGCINAYPLDEWKVYEQRLRELDSYDENNRAFVRRSLRDAEEVEMDRQQRIIIPRKLMNEAGIKSKVTIVGMLDHIEFWDPENYEKYINNYDNSFESLAKEAMKSK